MAKLREHIGQILEELRRIQAADHLSSALDGGIPGLIASNRGSVIVNGKIEHEIGAIARILMSDDATTARQFSNSEWRKLVRKALGQPLSEIDLDNDPATNVSHVLASLRAAVEEARRDYGQREYAVGCTLFGNSDVEPIVMGPVLIETREDWLARKLSAGTVTAITAGRVQRLWSGTHKLRMRKKSIDWVIEKGIIEAVGACSFVCSVNCNGLGTETGKDKALMAGRMALAAVALLWQRPSTVMEGFRLKVDGTVQRLKVLTFTSGKVILAGWKLSHLPTGHTFEPGKWKALSAHHADLFRVTAEILEFFLHPTGLVARPVLMNALMQALLWFHEGCRDTVNAMAIVKFTSSMEALAGGRKATGIRKLLTARIGIKEGDMLFRELSLTLKQAVELVYTEGRSRTVHGTNEKLAHDLTDMRNVAETLARLCLRGCMRWAAENPSEDSPDKLRTA